MSIFDQINNRPYLVIAHDTPTPVTFEDNEPASTIVNKYGAQQYEFNLDGDMILGISSKPLLRALKPFAPLGGKTLVIAKSGRGYDTTYTVEEVRHEKHWNTQLLARFWGMVTRTALPELFSWMLRELTVLALWVFLRELLD